MKYSFVLLFLTASLLCFCTAEASFTRAYPDVGVTQVDFDNGMRIFLKPDSRDRGEIRLKLQAKGGFASTEQFDRASIELSPKVVLASGVGDFSGDELAVYLEDEEIELSMAVQPFSRQIAAVSTRAQASKLLEVVSLLFRAPRLSEASYQCVLKSVLAKCKETADPLSFESAYLILNSTNGLVASPLLTSDVKNASFSSLQKAYRAAFGNPGDFQGLLVGDFKVDEMIPLLEKSLGALDEGSTSRFFSKKPPIRFPRGALVEAIPEKGKGARIARFATPLAERITPREMEALEVAVEIFNKRLQKRFEELAPQQDKPLVYIDTPFAPFKDPKWLAIHFHFRGEEFGRLRVIIIEEMRKLRETLPESGEVAEGLANVRSSLHHEIDESFWIKPNIFEELPAAGPDAEAIRRAVRQFMTTDRYTLLHT